MGIRLYLFRIHWSGTNVRDLLPHICNESLITAYPPVWGPSAFSSGKLAWKSLTTSATLGDQIAGTGRRGRGTKRVSQCPRPGGAGSRSRKHGSGYRSRGWRYGSRSGYGLKRKSMLHMELLQPPMLMYQPMILSRLPLPLSSWKVWNRTKRSQV